MTIEPMCVNILIDSNGKDWGRTLAIAFCRLAGYVTSRREIIEDEGEPFFRRGVLSLLYNIEDLLCGKGTPDALLLVSEMKQYVNDCREAFKVELIYYILSFLFVTEEEAETILSLNYRDRCYYLLGKWGCDQ